MGKSVPTPPAPPDYAGAAREQGVANKDAAVAGASLSNPNIYSPYGNQTVSYANTGPDGNAQPTITQTLTPNAQRALDAQQEVQYGLSQLGKQGLGTAQDVLGSRFNYDGPDIKTGLDYNSRIDVGPGGGTYGTASGINAGPQSQRNLDLSGVAKMPVNAGMTGQNAILARLQPQIEQNANATRQRLANQGIGIGSEAYNNEMRTQQQGENDLYSQAALQGIGLDTAANQQGWNQALGSAGLYNDAVNQDFTRSLGANQSQNAAIGQNFNQGLSASGFYNQAQNQGFNQANTAAQFGNQAALQRYQQQLAQYNQPLNQIAALMSGSQIQNPQFQAYSGQNVNAAPIFQGVQEQGRAAMDAYGIRANAAAQQNAGLYGALGSAAGMVAMSDIRLKTNITRIGTHPLGIGIYEYDIFGHREIGVMAQELEKVKPEAVILHSSGFKMVDYGAL